MKDHTLLPKEPGVYLFKNVENEIIYVGKANSLRNRVSSYFKGKDHSAKTQLLVSKINDIDYVIVSNEVEALLLENKLIKQHKPKYNIALKDSKTFAYLQITDEAYPRLLTTRRADRKGEYFGPYTDGNARFQLQQLAIKLFKLRVCKKLPKKECLNYHIGLCTAPCIGKVTREQYQEQVNQARRLIKGDSKEITKQLEKDMHALSNQLRYEEALEKRHQLQGIEYLQYKQTVDRLERFDQDVVVMQVLENMAIIELFSIKKGVISARKEYRFEHEFDIFEQFISLYYTQQPIPREIITNYDFENKKAMQQFLEKIRQGPVELTIPQKGDKKRLVDLALKNVRVQDERLVSLKEVLILPALPRIIECFDVSNLGEDFIVAAMTRFFDAIPDKSNYRKFEIKTTQAQNDFAAMHEAVYRRYYRLHRENKEMPNLIIIDGGQGHLSVALHALKKLGLQIPIIALAKEFEEIYTPGRSEPLQIDKNSPMMLLLRQIRDNTHRFVLSYNKQKRKIRMREQIKQ